MSFADVYKRQITAYAESFIYQIHKSPLKEVTTILLIARVNSIGLKKERDVYKRQAYG